MENHLVVNTTIVTFWKAMQIIRRSLTRYITNEVERIFVKIRCTEIRFA